MPITMQDIKEILVKRKQPLFKEFKERLESGDVVKPISMEDLEKQEENELKIMTGTLIDEMIGGGVPEGGSMLMYGEFGSGKTQTCFTTVALCPNKVIYIDTERSYRVSRMKEICKARGLDWNVIKKKIVYYRPKNWIEQMLILFSLPSPADDEDKIDLIICDSLSKHFRGIEFLGRENIGIKNGLLREFILTMEKLADMHKAAFIYTTQIYDTVAGSPMAGPAQTQKPVGGRSIEHQPDFVVFFRKGKGNIRIARMMDSSWKQLAERSFVINDKGIDKIPEAASAYSTEESRAKKFERKQEQEDIGTRGRRKTNTEDESEEEE